MASSQAVNVRDKFSEPKAMELGTAVEWGYASFAKTKVFPPQMIPHARALILILTPPTTFEFSPTRRSEHFYPL
jgi:hypothetical protein